MPVQAVVWAEAAQVPGGIQEASHLCLSGWGAVTWGRGVLEVGPQPGTHVTLRFWRPVHPLPWAPGTLGLPGTEAEVRVSSPQQNPGDHGHVQASVPSLPSRVSPFPPPPDELPRMRGFESRQLVGGWVIKCSPGRRPGQEAHPLGTLVSSSAPTWRK